MCQSLLQRISFGKYNSGLYFRGSLHYASTLGGIASIILTTVFIIYLVTVINNIFGDKPHFAMISKIEDINDYEEFRQSGAGLIGNFDKNFVESFQVRIEKKYNVSCDQIFVQFFLDSESRESYYSQMKHFLGINPELCRFLPVDDKLYIEFIANHSQVFSFNPPSSKYATTSIYKIWYRVYVPKNLTTYDLSFNYHKSLVAS